MKKIEEANQVAFVRWFRYQYPALAPLLTLGSFGENVGPKRMNRLKQMGLTPGYPDLILYWPKEVRDRQYCGLFIEMKTKTGRVSEVQANIHFILQRNYIVTVAHSFDEARDIITEYLSK